LGFIRERAFTTWWRSAISATPAPLANHNAFIVHPRRADWQAEYALATAQRPNEQGGIAWLQPVRQQLFRPSVWGSFTQLFSLTSHERLIIRAADNETIAATLWIEHGWAQASTRLVLMTQPEYHDPYAEVLLNSVLQRFRTTSIVIDHPADDTRTNILLEHYRFRSHRTLWHMRLPLA
jgi:hypothetical protein